MVQPISAGDIARALEEALRAAQDTEQTEIDWSKGLTSAELGEHLDVTATHALSLLRRAIKAGLVEYGGRSHRPNIAGGNSSVPVYRVVKQGSKGN